MPAPSRACFQVLNLPDDAIPESMSAFELYAPPHTDLWRKPPAADTATAPILFTALRHPFVSAEVQVSADWQLEWDQAGLVIFAGMPPTSTNSPVTPVNLPAGSDGSPPAYPQPPPGTKWVKVGLEFCNNVCHASSVCATSDGADWTTTSLSPTQAACGELRIKLERIGYALWVSYEDQHLGWKKMREVTWFFYGVENKSVRVGVYASRPANFPLSLYERRHGIPSVTQSSLRVEFDGLQIF
jgi:regulation of enolase protein 1 (concanavalin A-like superfamily)